jgi:hypothetical protein|tara:strand:+ start:66 stop:266 length:201 start_codon:yes stop_codon:yes gene_type:complete
MKKRLGEEDIRFIGSLMIKNSPQDIDKLVGSLAVQLTHYHSQKELHRYLNPIFFLAGLLIGYYIGA